MYFDVSAHPVEGLIYKATMAAEPALSTASPNTNPTFAGSATKGTVALPSRLRRAACASLAAQHHTGPQQMEKFLQ